MANDEYNEGEVVEVTEESAEETDAGEEIVGDSGEDDDE